MYLHTDDGSSDYPLALGSLAVAESSQPAKVSPVARLSSRAEDLYSFGAISATDRARIIALLSGGDILNAEAIISDAERKFQNKTKSVGWMDNIDNIFPAGYKLNDHLITSVPNYVLYGGALLGMIFLRSAMKRKS